MPYVGCLVDAYDDHCDQAIQSSDDALSHDTYGEHLRSSRKDFYCAESLREFSKDVLIEPDDFESLQQEIYDGVKYTIDRLRIRKLRVSGPGKEDAFLAFGTGLTFVTGLSNTGKSHVLECIDYALAAGSSPRTIPEANGYDRVTVEFEADGASWTISRPLGGSEEAIVFDGTLEDLSGDGGEAIKVHAPS
jgi:hypothetical protein